MAETTEPIAPHRPQASIYEFLVSAPIVLWLVCIAKAYQGRPFKLPCAGARAERYANTRAGG